MLISNKVKNELLQDFDNLTEELSDFDSNHLNLVSSKAIEIAGYRNLDPNLAEVIARFHDIGRIKEGLDFTKHGFSGSEFLKEYYYKEEPFNDFNLMTTAIKNHSRKSKIDDPYSELIKDADSYAHSIEFTDLKEKELLRIEYLDCPPFRVKWSSNKLWYLKIKEHSAQLLELLEQTEVHQTRITIRKLRTLLKLQNGIEYQKFYNNYNKILKEIFKHFELSRILTVFLEEFPDCSFKKEVLVMIDEEDSETKEILSECRSDLQKIVSLLPDSGNIDFEKQISDLLSDYRSKLDAVDFNNIDTLHRLRISGKKLKYLMELDLISYNNDHYELLSLLHKSIGSLNDIRENRIIIKSKLFEINKEEKKQLKAKMIKDEDELLEKLKKEVFVMKLLFNRSYY